MIKYRKNEKWGTHSFESSISTIDKDIKVESAVIQRDNLDFDIDIVDINISNTSTIDKDYDIRNNCYVSIMYALIDTRKEI